MRGVEVVDGSVDIHGYTSLIRNLEGDTASAMFWFESNYMILNQPKCHALISGKKNSSGTAVY